MRERRLRCGCVGDRSAARVNLAAVTPAPASSGYCLAARGRAYIVYASGGKNLKVDLAGVEGEITTSWMDPTTGGAARDAPAVRGGGPIECSPPGADSDVALYLCRSR